MSELGEQTKTIAKRKDALTAELHLNEFFYTFDNAITLPNGNLEQTSPTEKSGVLRALAKAHGTFYEVNFDLTFPPFGQTKSELKTIPPLLAERRLIWAQMPNGRLLVSIGSEPSTEGAPHTIFHLWKEARPELLENFRAYGHVVNQLRTTQEQPFPSTMKRDLQNICFALS